MSRPSASTSRRVSVANVTLPDFTAKALLRALLKPIPVSGLPLGLKLTSITAMDDAAARRDRRGQPADQSLTARSVCSRTCFSRTEPSSSPISRGGPVSRPAGGGQEPSQVVIGRRDPPRRGRSRRRAACRRTRQQPRPVSPVLGHRVDDELLHLAVAALLGVVVRARHGGGEADHPFLIDRHQDPVAGPGRPGDGGQPGGGHLLDDEPAQHHLGQVGRKLGRPRAPLELGDAGRFRRPGQAYGVGDRSVGMRNHRSIVPMLTCDSGHNRTL